MRCPLALFVLLGSIPTSHAQDAVLPEAVRAAQHALAIAPREEYCERTISLAAAYRAADMLDSAHAAADRALRYTP